MTDEVYNKICDKLAILTAARRFYDEKWLMVIGEPTAIKGCCTPQLCQTCGPGCGGRESLPDEPTMVEIKCH